MKMLLIDVETAPTIAATFQLKNAFIRNEQILEHARMLSFSAKWYGPGNQCEFWSEYSGFGHTHEMMAQRLHALLDEADVVIYFNGDRFDKQWANTEMKRAGLMPPSPYKTVDLFQQSLKFRLESHKLEHVSTYLVPAGGKFANSGFKLWLGVMGYLGEDAVAASWAEMRTYNMQDVEVMEPVFDDLYPWMTGLPNRALIDDEHTERDEDGHIIRLGLVCRCGSTNVIKHGFRYTGQSKFQRYECKDCGSWMSDTRAIARVGLVEAR